MGQVILPTGKAISIDDINGKVYLKRLVEELENTDLTDSYRIAVIGAVSRLGKFGDSGIPSLNKIKESNNKLLKEAAEQAIKKIQRDTNPLAVVQEEVVAKVAPPPPPPVYHGHYGARWRDKNRVKMTLLPGNIFDGCVTISTCHFCNKLFDLGKKNKEIFPNERFCRFCVRSKHYVPEITQNILGINYKALIGYIYYTHIAKNQVFFYDLNEMVKEHVNTGLANPLFNYDSDNFQWHIDMRMVNSGEISIKSISSTIISQLCSLGIGEIFCKGNPSGIYRKIIEEIYSGNKKIVPLPTDGGVAIGEGVPMGLLKEFCPSLLVDPPSPYSRRRGY